jgi:uncharacterized protein (DUF1800 family)
MATFGPTQAEITRLRGIGYGQWIQQQLSLPASLEEPSVEDHDDTDVKTLLSYAGNYGSNSNALTLPANNGCEPDLDQGMAIIAQHPNVAPFISRRLIERLVTSNPSSC